MQPESVTFDGAQPVALPNDIEFYKDDCQTIAYAPSIASWVVLDGKEKLFFQILAECHSLDGAVERFTKIGGTKNEYMNVLAELVDKNFFYNSSPAKLDFEYKTITCNVTDACNIRCITCFRGCTTQKFGELETHDWLRIIKTHANIGGNAIRISGGEPLLKIELVSKLLKQAKELKYDTALLTNGTLLNINSVELLKLSGLDRIQISLDGPTEATNDRVRGHGTFAKVMNALDILSGSNIEVFMAMVPVPGITDDVLLEQGSEFARRIEHKFDGDIYFNIAQGLIDGREVKQENSPNFIKKCGIIQDNIGSHNKSAALDLWRFTPGQSVPSCGYGCQLTIEADGEVKNCAIGESVCNVKDLGLEEIIMMLKFNALNNLVDGIEQCKKCPLRYLCGGPCRINPQECTKETRSFLVERLVKSNNYRYHRAE